MLRSEQSCRYGLEEAVDTQARLQRAAEGFDVHVGGTLLDRQPQQVIQRTHHRSATRKVAQIVQILLAGHRLSRCAGARRHGLEAYGECGVNVVACRNRKAHRPLQRDLRRTQCFRVDRSGDREQRRSFDPLPRQESTRSCQENSHLPSASSNRSTVNPMVATRRIPPNINSG